MERLRQELDDVAQGRFDIVIGTQLVAKGHHFPKLNLVGIVDADLGLANGDPRAAERTFQLLHQVVGRAGREEGRGYGYLQTHQPEHPVMRALIAQDREAFYAAEIAVREKTGYPPFGRLASLLISGADKHATEGYARKIAAVAPIHDQVRVLGPAEAPLAVVRGRHRFRLLVKSPRNFDLSAYLREWLAAAPKAQRHAQARGRRRSAELFLAAVGTCWQTGRYSSVASESRYCGVSPDSCTTSCHILVSFAAKALASAGVLCSSRPPAARKRFCSASSAAISLCAAEACRRWRAAWPPPSRRRPTRSRRNP